MVDETEGGFKSPEEKKAAEQFEAGAEDSSEQGERDLTSKEGVISLMRSSEDEKAWNANCDAVKEANNGYPEFWFPEIVQSGILGETQRSWKK